MRGVTNIIEHIKNQGGMLSGELAEYIGKAYKITEVAARKRIERLQSPIHKLKGLFADNQSFVYHSDNFNNEEYFVKLGEAIQKSAKRCYAVISAINYHHGIISKEDLANYTFSPKSNIKGHLSYNTLVAKLIQAGIIYDYDENSYSLNIHIAQYSDPNFNYFKAIQFTKNLLLGQFATWSRNIGLTSFNTGERNKEIGGFQFAFASPSYINGLVQYNKEHKPKPGFVITDVLIGNSTTESSIDFFNQKINAIRSSNPSLRLFPVLIVDGVEVNALNKLKKNGVLIATVREIFGEGYNELLKNLIKTITNAGAILKKEPESYINLMLQLTKLVDGKTNNLRGDLFELAVGYYYGQFCQSLDIGKKVRIETDIKQWEIDVLAKYEDEVRVVECKGYNYSVGEEYIQKYLSERIPAFRKWLDKYHPDKKQVFEIWSTGGFTEEALVLLSNAKLKTRKYSINYLDKNQILEKAKELGSNKFTEILRDYYFKELV